MKRTIALLLILSLILVGCGNNIPQDSTESAKNTTETTESVVDDIEVETLTDSIRTDEEGDSSPYEYVVDFDSLNDEELNRYITDNIYSTLIADLDSNEYYVDNVEAVYVSQEYIDAKSELDKDDPNYAEDYKELEKNYNNVLADIADMEDELDTKKAAAESEIAYLNNYIESWQSALQQNVGKAHQYGPQ